jgi:hypothetical protein
MMPVTETNWSETEKKIAQEAFDKAYQREILALIEEVRGKASSLQELDDLWYLNDLLSARRHQIDGKYDYRYSVLIFIFAQLLKEGWLHLQDLDGLDQDKLKKIVALARM